MACGWRSNLSHYPQRLLWGAIRYCAIRYCAIKISIYARGLFCGRSLKRVHNGIPYWGSIGLLKGNIPVVVYRHGGKYFASSNLDLTRDEIRRLYSIRTGIEEVFRVLKQECGWQGVQARRVRSYRTQLTAGVLGFFWLGSLAKTRKCSVYKLRRKLIAGRLQVTEVDALEFLEAA